MSVLLSRLFLATALVATPVFAQSDTDEPAEPVAAESATETEAPAEATDDGEGEAAAETSEAEENDADEWAKNLRKRHHEGDVALGVCGARMSVLMWFYQSSVADGREDLQPALEAITESRTVIKNEAERRAVEDGVGTSVSVMNEYSEEYWLELVEASEDADKFQTAYDDLFTNVQECLSLFFKRDTSVAAPDVDEATVEEEATSEEEKAE